jgi:putative Ca2+/H+ antiporter (TMEM165/GDT1 family)
VSWNTPLVHVATLVTAFATIFFAELPDKTMLATIVLSARFRRPLSVWAGAAAALTAHVLVASAAGRLLSLLPQRPVRFAVAALFLVGAVVLWRSRDAEPADVDEHDVIAGDLPERDDPEAARAASMPAKRIVATVFGIVFIAEWGDLTQIATASLAAKGHAISVFLGAAAAMILVAAIGAIAGRTLLRVVPARVLHRAAAVIFAVLAVVFLVDAVRAVDIDGSVAATAPAADGRAGNSLPGRGANRR